MSSLAATNPRGLAPEILAGHAATFASDVYAFGIVLWEMLTWELPWPTSNPWQVVTVVTEGGRLAVPDRAALPGPDTQDWDGLDAYATSSAPCWAQNPNDRPTFSEVIPVLSGGGVSVGGGEGVQGREGGERVGTLTWGRELGRLEVGKVDLLAALGQRLGRVSWAVAGRDPCSHLCLHLRLPLPYAHARLGGDTHVC